MSDKTTDPEAEYFARIEREKKAALAKEISAERAGTEREALKKLHWLRCGKCGGEMAPQVFRGVEIDVCKECTSVLLDPGELEQLAGQDQSGALSAIAGFFTLRRG